MSEKQKEFLVSIGIDPNDERNANMVGLCGI